MIKGGKFLPMGTLTELPNAVRPLVAGDGIPRRILAFLPPLDVGVDSLRVISRGGWMFIERNLRTALVDGLLSPETTCGELYKKWLQSSPTGTPATGAEMMALSRGLQQKAVMINLVNELQMTCEVKDTTFSGMLSTTAHCSGVYAYICFASTSAPASISTLITSPLPSAHPAV